MESNRSKPVTRHGRVGREPGQRYPAPRWSRVAAAAAGAALVAAQLGAALAYPHDAGDDLVFVAEGNGTYDPDVDAAAWIEIGNRRRTRTSTSSVTATKKAQSPSASPRSSAEA